MIQVELPVATGDSRAGNDGYAGLMGEVGLNSASSDGPGMRPWLAAGLAIVVVLTVVVGRLSGPSDLHDQTQEKTTAYTVNLALHLTDWKHWALPMQQETWPATKPPLYNWLAVPGVALTEGRYEWAHRLPSVLSFVALAWLVWVVGRRIDPWGMTGAAAVVALSADYAMFKLSALVRPDTLLTLWISLGWVGLTILSASDVTGRARGRWMIITWVCMALAGLTKGPAALVLAADVVVLGFLVNPARVDGEARRVGRWKSAIGQSMRRTGAWWGVPAAIGVGLAWLGLVWWINPEHAYQTLLRTEFIDRAAGTGVEGVKEGPWDFVRTALNMPWYFITRWLPWSVLFLGALIDLARARRERGDLSRLGDWSSRSARLWMVSALVHTVVVVVLFSLSAGKRADYIAPAYVSGALVAGWCATNLGWQLARRHGGLVMGLGLVIAGLLIAHDRTMGFAVQYPLGERLHSFVDQVRPKIEGARARGERVEFYRTGSNPLQSLLFCSQAMVNDDLEKRLDSNGTTWLFANPTFLEEVLTEDWAQGWRFEEEKISIAAPGNAGAKPFQVGLYVVRRAEAPR